MTTPACAWSEPCLWDGDEDEPCPCLEDLEPEPEHERPVEVVLVVGGVL